MINFHWVSNPFNVKSQISGPKPSFVIIFIYIFILLSFTFIFIFIFTLIFFIFYFWSTFHFGLFLFGPILLKPNLPFPIAYPPNPIPSAHDPGLLRPIADHSPPVTLFLAVPYHAHTLTNHPSEHHHLTSPPSPTNYPSHLISPRKTLNLLVT